MEEKKLIIRDLMKATIVYIYDNNKAFRERHHPSAPRSVNE